MAEQRKIFKDPVHGTIELHPLLVKIIDTPQFQRLRNIKQLGAVSYVYPGATHSRFEHSIGVAYLAGEILKSIKEKQKELGITDWDVLCVQFAALCHDLGHGPFSHMFDLMFLPEARQLKRDELSKKIDDLLKHMKKMTGEDQGDSEEIKELQKLQKEIQDLIKDLIDPKTEHEELSKKMIDHLMEKNDDLLKQMYDVRKKMTDEDSEKVDGVLTKMEDVQKIMTDKDKGHSGKIEELKKILKKYLKEYLKEDLDFIKDLIDPPKKTIPATDQPTGGSGGARKQRPPANRSEKRYILYDIVSNTINKIDVDKWDYFARDCHYLGMKNSFDHERLIKSARACKVNGKWQICYRDKDVFNLYDMFYTRFSLHKRAYQHKVKNAIELMIKEAFIKAKEHKFEDWTLSTAIEDMGAYTKLTDTVFDQILNSTSAELQEARGILERIVKRDHYYCLGEFHSEDTLQVIKENWKTFHQGTQEEYIVDDVTFNYGKRAHDPIEDVRFYNKRNPQQARAITRAEVSRLLPETFEETIYRIYTRRMDKDLKDDEDAFEKFRNNSYKKKN
ncbi:deoxynucleoside triphosphate triphosphohydrolase SAMHD1-like isoform X2 [Cyprinodon tularosa]|uniref:deoxynucleoside triphosphate triphosphohydrolase SAMHD1-like isoform X2 n=1 Tax=Cyprinodon tularosa TaxID=77115 RepID=UPI0018E28BB8|nr:deoxynucleoside triphosphate triphosphohydrolase SAMHD1-like isoform X2 [Cyprinodon tularosa]